MKLSRRAFLQSGVLLGAAAVRPSALPLPPPPPRTPRTLQEKVGQLFVVSFPGTSPSVGFVSLLERLHLGGVILYGRNCVSGTQIRTLVAGLQHASAYPLLVGVDQEGGSVVRIRQGAHVFPAEAVYGRIGSAARVTADAATTARDLRALGITMNLAPVVDVLSNSRSPIGDRSYGSNPALVASLSAAAVRGYQQHRVAAVAKHFVGLGHTSIDSHQALPTVTKTLAQLERVDLVPFRAAIAAGVSTILVAHVALPAIDPSRRPASLSPPIIGGVIRRRLGFKGAVMTDSLAMGALPQGSTADSAEKAFAAGADILLISSDRDIPSAVIEDASSRIVAAVRAGRIPRSRLDSAVARILVLKRAYL